MTSTTVVIHAKEPSPLDLSGRIPELDGICGIAIGMVLIGRLFEVVSRQ